MKRRHVLDRKLKACAGEQVTQDLVQWGNAGEADAGSHSEGTLSLLFATGLAHFMREAVSANGIVS